MRDPLQDLADEIKKGHRPAAPVARTAPAPRPQPVQRPVRPQATVVKGEGGMIFNFGQWTGNPVADNATALLNRHSDPVQNQIAQYQRESMAKALHTFVLTGQDPQAEAPAGGVHQEWERQFNKSLDQQVVEGIKSGEIPVEGGMPGAPGQQIKGDFNKSQMQLGGETIVGQSETDAAVIEMMKSMPQPDADEHVIDATEQ